MLMVVTTAVGHQGGNDVSVFRVVKVLADGIYDDFYPIGSGPDKVHLV